MQGQSRTVKDSVETPQDMQDCAGTVCSQCIDSAGECSTVWEQCRESAGQEDSVVTVKGQYRYSMVTVQDSAETVHR